MKGAFVHAYKLEEYAEMKLFLSADQKSCGVALKNVDVVSVFKHPLAETGALAALMPLAILQGGRRLDCFYIESGLPLMYSKF